MFSWLWASYAFGHSLSNALVTTHSILFCPKTTDSSLHTCVCVCMCVCARLAAATHKTCAFALCFCYCFSACQPVGLSACPPPFWRQKSLAHLRRDAQSEEFSMLNVVVAVTACCLLPLQLLVVCCWRLSRSLSSCPTLSVCLCLSFLVFSSQRVGGFLFVQKLVASGKDTTWTWNRFPHFFTHIYIRVCVFKYLEQALFIRFAVALSFVIVFKKLCR